MTFKEKWIGDKSFYKKMMVTAIPIIIQNFITNFVGLLDNIMVGQMGTDQMNGVSIANQLFFVFYLCLWGAMGGAGIFSAQYYGKGDHEGVRNTFRAKLIIGTIILAVSIGVFLLFGDNLVSIFLHETDGIGDVQATLGYAHNYYLIMLIGLLPMTVATAYSNTLRDTSETVLPMKAGIVAVFVNLVLNFLLIEGHLGAPALGATGAAIATVISRFVECGIVIIWTHTHKKKAMFIEGAYKTLKVPGELMKNIIKKGTPLAANETLWSAGISVLNAIYAYRGLTFIGAMSIASTINNLFSVVYLATGDAIAILIGQMLGAGKLEEAKESDRKMIAFSFTICLGIGAIMACFSGLFPLIYKTEPEIRQLATSIILMQSAFMPVWAILHGTYFTLRTGGQTIVTFIFDSAFVWVLCVPLALVLVNFTGLPIFIILLIVQCLDILKAILGIILVRWGKWCKKIV